MRLVGLCLLHPLENVKNNDIYVAFVTNLLPCCEYLPSITDILSPMLI